MAQHLFETCGQRVHLSPSDASMLKIAAEDAGLHVHIFPCRFPHVPGGRDNQGKFDVRWNLPEHKGRDRWCRDCAR